MKIKVFAPVNLALIKYWGVEDAELRIPANSNISVCLERLGTETEVEFRDDLVEDRVVIDGEEVSDKERERVTQQLDRVRELAKIKMKAEVVSKNNFPKSVGLSSSASGMAALSVAASKSAGLDLNEEDLSRLSRLASGSSCRSIPDGWVEWIKGKDNESSYAYSLHSADYWDLRVLIVELKSEAKKVSSTEGHKLARTSVFFEERLRWTERKIEEMKKTIKDKNFSELGRIAEAEAVNMHAVMLTSKPSLMYWLPETVRVMRKIREWREEGLESYFSVNTGQSVFVLCERENEDELVSRLEKIEGVTRARKDKIGSGVRVIN